jgi:hypothetical protein
MMFLGSSLFSNTRSNDDSFKRTGHSYPEAGILFKIVSNGVKYIRVIAVLRKVST